MEILICSNIENAEEFKKFQEMKACLLGFEGVSEENFRPGQVCDVSEEERKSWGEAFKARIEVGDAIAVKQIYFDPEGTCLDVKVVANRTGTVFKLFQKAHQDRVFIESILGHGENSTATVSWCSAHPHASTAFDGVNTVALLDVDETLALTKSLDRGCTHEEQGYWYLNETLVQSLEAAHIKDVYLFTAYHARSVAKRSEDWMVSAPSRLYLKEALEQRGIKVHEILVPDDIAYRHGPGKHFEHHIAPHEAVIKAGQDLDVSPESVYATDCAQERRWSAANISKPHDKGEMFAYLLEQVPALKDKRLIFVDDSKGHIESVTNKAHELNQPLTVVKCTYDLTVENYLKSFCGVEKTQHRLAEKQNKLESIYKKSSPKFFITQATKIKHEVCHAKAFNALALAHLARRYLEGKDVTKDPMNARKLAQLSYALAETDFNCEQATVLLTECLIAIQLLPKNAHFSLTEKDVSGRVLETSYLEQASFSEKAIYYHRLAKCYQHESQHPDSEATFVNVLRHAVECYFLAWQLGYRYENQDVIDIFKSDFHSLINNNQRDHALVKEEFIAKGNSDIVSFFTAMESPKKSYFNPAR